MSLALFFPTDWNQEHQVRSLEAKKRVRENGRGMKATQPHRLERQKKERVFNIGEKVHH